MSVFSQMRDAKALRDEAARLERLSFAAEVRACRMPPSDRRTSEVLRSADLWRRAGVCRADAARLSEAAHAAGSVA